MGSDRADGVPTKDVYKVLNTPEGVDRAFKKVDTIKKDVVWWTSLSQPAQLLADGRVIIAASGQSAIYDANKNCGKHLETMWDAQLLALDFWVIPKGSPHLDAAYKFHAFFGSPQAQARLTHYVPLSPANNDALALVDPAMKPYLATSHMGNALAFDTAFWNEKGDELNQRFTAWLAK
ncbi:extracellular solute-binding protein [Bradyrhizobium australiense]|uniref:extracellular solute-binding protein n=1 Tax=Bradyrhizobium australiense TaxID=2721161 RepID=UPI0024BF1FED|nr:extracellular solute-binding protein [Bradyrhizobium australiense]